jgi:hypothetical protein
MTRKRTLIAVGGLLVIAGGALAFYIYSTQSQSDSNDYIYRWFNERQSRLSLITENQEPCSGAPFLLPSSGFIGLLYRDPARPYHIFRRHTGVDIFGNGEPGDVPVVAVYDGYLTRLNDWFATVIIRHDDPLQAGRTIWTYYTHMGNRSGTTSFVSDEFPPGTADKFVKQGTLLGYQGKYAGIGVPVGLHVHLSIVASDADGSFKNEAILDNTLDPSPYFGLPLNIDDHPKRPIKCGLSEN